jgi:transforming growth factor-beta-induced protein
MFTRRRSSPPISFRHPGTAAVLLGGVLALAAACGEAEEGPRADAPRSAPPPAQNSIVEVAQAAGQFSALLQAVEAAGLTETLQEGGPFTVFAPTDGAFSNLPEGAMEELLDNPEALADILLYHVVSGEYTLAELRDLSRLETVQGEALEISSTRQGLLIGGASILTADVRAANGIIHVMTQVLLP